MTLGRNILAAAYQPLKLTNILLAKLNGRKGRLRVLLYHDIAPYDEPQFIAQIQWLMRSWHFITPNTFASMISGNEPLEDDYLLLSFDDGFLSNKKIAENILNPMGIKALFFVMPKFADLTSKSDCKKFIVENIYPDMQSKDIPNHWRNMSWDDLIFLLETGHTIGAHTDSHARLSKLSSNDLIKEIILSADFLAHKLRCPIEHFAYTFGDLGSFSSEALKVSRSRFKFIYTGFRGNNNLMPWAIRRDAVSAKDSNFLLGAFLEGGADRLYVKSLSVYQKWAEL